MIGCLNKIMKSLILLSMLPQTKSTNHLAQAQVRKPKPSPLGDPSDLPLPLALGLPNSNKLQPPVHPNGMGIRRLDSNLSNELHRWPPRNLPSLWARESQNAMVTAQVHSLRQSPRKAKVQAANTKKPKPKASANPTNQLGSDQVCIEGQIQRWESGKFKSQSQLRAFGDHNSCHSTADEDCKASGLGLSEQLLESTQVLILQAIRSTL